MPEFEPAPWTADTRMDVVGQCVPRVDALEKVTGCAETQEAANRGARAAIVRVETEPHAVSSEAALRPNAPKVRSQGNTSKNSPRVTARGDVDAAIAAADVVVRREYRTPVALHSAMEPHGAVAEWLGDQLTVWESTQGIFNTRTDLAEAFGLKLT